MIRRDFIKNTSLATAAFAIGTNRTAFFAGNKVRLGYIGVGARGMSHIGEAVLRDDVDIVAVCDTQESSLKKCREYLQKKDKRSNGIYRRDGRL